MMLDVMNKLLSVVNQGRVEKVMKAMDKTKGSIFVKVDIKELA